MSAHGLSRFVVTANGQLQSDRRRNQPGRGAWICPSTPCVRAALKTRAFPRALRSAVQVPSEIELLSQLGIEPAI
ncbi:MAG: YlxR family protein [Myxococcales bacterium]|nr:YlxR family protein [Myxococcales bacterium]